MVKLSMFNKNKKIFCKYLCGCIRKVGDNVFLGVYEFRYRNLKIRKVGQWNEGAWPDTTDQEDSTGNPG
jgi:hypothetical protein